MTPPVKKKRAPTRPRRFTEALHFRIPLELEPALQAARDELGEESDSLAARSLLVKELKRRAKKMEAARS